MADLEKEKAELLELIEKNIDPDLQKVIEIINSSTIREETQNELIITSEGTTNA